MLVRCDRLTILHRCVCVGISLRPAQVAEPDPLAGETLRGRSSMALTWAFKNIPRSLSPQTTSGSLRDTSVDVKEGLGGREGVRLGGGGVSDLLTGLRCSVSSFKTDLGSPCTATSCPFPPMASSVQSGLPGTACALRTWSGLTHTDWLVRALVNSTNLSGTGLFPVAGADSPQDGKDFTSSPNFLT